MSDFNATIKLDFAGVSQRELVSIQQTIEILFQSGVFHIKNGKAILNFDHEGVLQEISLDYKKWRRKKIDTNDHSRYN
jgi:hypothetical protein